MDASKPSYRAGDILLVDDYNPHGDLIGELIRAGQRARYGDSDWSRWTHSALIVSPQGDLIEALEEGIKRSHISKYASHNTSVISPDAGYEPRVLAVRFAEAQLDTKYDVLDFVTLALSVLTGLNLSLHSDKRFICSGLVSRATEKYIPAYPLPSESMMPADLACFWKSDSGLPLPKLSWIGAFLDRLRIVSRAFWNFIR